MQIYEYLEDILEAETISSLNRSADEGIEFGDYTYQEDNSKDNNSKEEH